MAKIALDRLLEGMVVATDVRDVNGRVLVPAGEVLTAQHLHGMRARGVPEVEVSSGSIPVGAQPGESFPAPVLEQAAAQIAELFRLANTGEPMMQELQRLCILRRARKLRGDA